MLAAVVVHDRGIWRAASSSVPLRSARLRLWRRSNLAIEATIELGFEQNWRSWHFLFNTIPDLPEALLQGRERILIQWFFHKKAANPAGVFSTADIDEYERVYSKLGNLGGMLGYYRAVFEVPS
jgi:hypothetical protein